MHELVTGMHEFFRLLAASVDVHLEDEIGIPHDVIDNVRYTTYGLDTSAQISDRSSS